MQENIKKIIKKMSYIARCMTLSFFCVSGAAGMVDRSAVPPLQIGTGLLRQFSFGGVNQGFWNVPAKVYQ